MKWINYHHLIYFKEIAQQGSISKASKILNVGQPALSAQLKSLESYLGTDLFERKNRRLILTNPGKVALEYALKISELGQELVHTFENRVYSEKLNLNVGALDSIPKHLICDIVNFAHKKTGCFLSILEDSFDGLLRQLRAHTLDIIISDKELVGDSENNLFSKRILHRPIVAYSSPQYKDLRKNFPHSLEGMPCIVPTIHSKVRQDIEHYFYLNDIRPKFIAETQDTSLQKILASKGDGIIFLPHFTTKELIQDKKLIKIGPLENVNSEYFLVYGKKIFENPALDLVLKQNFEKMRLGL